MLMLTVRGSIRRECLDHMGVFGEAHVRRTLEAYGHYYNSLRTHRSLAKDAPSSRPVQRIGHIMSHALLGGLHHHYVRFEFSVRTAQSQPPAWRGNSKAVDRRKLGYDRVKLTRRALPQKK